MGIGRLFIIGLVIWLVWFIFKRLKSSSITQKIQQKASKVAAVKQCAICEVHVPENEAIKKGDLYYCCKAHADENQ